MRIGIIGTGVNQIGGVVIDRLRKQGHEVITTEPGDKLQGLEFDAVFVEECVPKSSIVLELWRLGEMRYIKDEPSAHIFKRERTYPTLREKLRGFK